MSQSNDYKKIEEVVLHQLQTNPQDCKAFYTVFVYALEEYPNLSYKDYENLLSIIQQNTSESSFSGYYSLFQKLLKYKEKTILNYEKKQAFESYKREVLKQIQTHFDSIELANYSNQNQVKIKKIKLKAEKQIHLILLESNYKEELKEIIKIYETKVKQIPVGIKKIKPIKLYVGAFCGIISIIFILFMIIGSIPKVTYCTIEQYNKNHNEKLNYTVQELENKNLNEVVCVTGISGLIFPFHFPKSTVEIKKEYQKKPVIAVAAEAFQSETIRKLILPNTIKVIEKSAFNACKRLKYIHTNKKNQKEENILPTQVTRIKEKAFYGCISLNAITIEPGLKQIEEDSFAACNHNFYINFNGSSTQWGMGEQFHPQYIVQCKSYRIKVYGMDKNFLFEKIAYPGKPFYLGTPPEIPGYFVLGYFYEGDCLADSNGDSYDNYSFYKDIYLDVVYRPFN